MSPWGLQGRRPSRCVIPSQLKTFGICGLLLSWIPCGFNLMRANLMHLTSHKCPSSEFFVWVAGNYARVGSDRGTFSKLRAHATTRRAPARRKGRRALPFENVLRLQPPPILEPRRRGHSLDPEARPPTSVWSRASIPAWNNYPLTKWGAETRAFEPQPMPQH
jgi:hypothetical protein